ncbi:MAG: leucine-rich repeat domain-containing protein [Muribaculaceae bacterium]|nr:leucine-rich repeat domain-containing protein [Muribaculaceae bacterium]
MKKLFLLTLAALLATLPATAYDFMVDGLCYNKNSDGTSVTVTCQNSTSPRYSNLTGSLVIPSTVTYNGITYSVTTIGYWAFYGCSGLTSVTIPNSVTSIGYEAFWGCSGLMSVTIPNSVTSIGNYAFSSCSGLTSVTIPGSVTSIGDGAFSGCSGLKSVTWNAKNYSDFSNSYYSPFNNLTNIQSFTFGDEVEHIPAFVCDGLSGLTSVTIGKSVITIGNQTFSGCTGLTSVTIPNSVTSIGSSAFSGCNHLNKLVIGENVANIGEYAFAAPALTDVVVLRPRPVVIPENTFDGVSMVGCDLHVKQGSKVRYEQQDVWKDFMFIIEDAEDYAGGDSGSGSGTGIKGDVNGDGVVSGADVTALYEILLK